MNTNSFSNRHIGVNSADANAMLKEFYNEKEISQDDLRRGEEIIQTLTDDYVTKIDLLLEKKEKDLLEI